MSKAVKTLFGGTDRSAQRLTSQQNQLNRDFIQQQLGGGRQQLQQGYGSAFDLLSGSLPSQINAINQGTSAAQQYLMGGLPAFQSAILGGSGNPLASLQGQQPTQINPDLTFAQRPQNTSSLLGGR